MDFTNWPVWAALAFLLFTNQHTLKFLDKIFSVFGIALSGSRQVESDEREWRRSREDKMFEVLSSLIEGYQRESQDRDKILSGLNLSLQKNTDVLARQIDMIRLLAYNAATVDEKMEEIHLHIQTQLLRQDDDEKNH